MPQITLYVDSDTAQKLARQARRAGVSRSRFVRTLIQRGTLADWPESFKAMAGSWRDIGTAEGLRRKIGRDARRATF